MTTGSTDIRKIIRENYKYFGANKINNLDEMYKFLERYKLLKLRKKK